MSEEATHNLPDGRSFEERVFARFDAIDAGLHHLNVRMESLETRVQRLEEESARRAVDTKPIWERALAEITAVRQEVAVLSQKVDTLTERVDDLSERVDTLAERVDKFEHKLEVFWEDMLALRSDQRTLRKRMDKLEVKPAT
jgi:chromosome segregation ATPase